MPTLREQAAERAAAFAVRSAARDEEVVAYASKKRETEQSVRTRAIDVPSRETNYYQGPAKTADPVQVDLGPTGEIRGAGTVSVLAPTEVLIEIPTVPPDLANYSLVPVDFETLFEIMPGGGALQFLPAVFGSLMIMLGKRMLVTMAIAGIEYLAMEPLHQYGKGLPKARVLWHTGKSNSRPGERIAPARRGDGPFPAAEGVYYGSFLEAAIDGFQKAWEQVKKQWQDPAAFVPWLWNWK